MSEPSNSAIQVRLETGEEVNLEPGSTFPLNTHLDTVVLAVATHLTGQPSPVLCATTWKHLKELIDNVDSKSEQEINGILVSASLAASTVDVEDAYKDPKQWKQYIEDLWILLVIVRKLRGDKILVLQEAEKEHINKDPFRMFTRALEL